MTIVSRYLATLVVGPHPIVCWQLSLKILQMSVFGADWDQNFKTGSPLDSLVSFYLHTPKGDLEGDKKRKCFSPF